MLKIKPNSEIWARVNQAIMNENAGEVVVTVLGGMCSILLSAGAVASVRQARIHLAAMLLSPDDGPVGSLVVELVAELERLRHDETLN